MSLFRKPKGKKDGAIELDVVIVIPDKSATIHYQCPHCCTGEKRVVEEFPFEFVPKFAKEIIEYKGINKVCGNCGKTFLLVGNNTIKNTLRPWL